MTVTSSDLDPLTLPLYSQLNGPISALSRLHKSLLFAELSNVAYYNEHYATQLAKRVSFDNTVFFDRDGAQAFLFSNKYDRVIACRGTEPNEWNDIKADINALTDLFETFGRVHRGFKRETDDLWPMMLDTLLRDNKPLWFTGHSLGGAMAAICAGRCYIADIPFNPQELYTYGSPRVGNRRYINSVNVNYTRWVNNNDIVTRVPPTWMGYRHSGQEVYLNAYGKVRRMTGWQRTKDRWRGFIAGIKQGSVDHFSDHLIDDYIKHIYNTICEQENIKAHSQT